MELCVCVCLCRLIGMKSGHVCFDSRGSSIATKMPNFKMVCRLANFISEIWFLRNQFPNWLNRNVL